jgi:hypothetical protein
MDEEVKVTEMTVEEPVGNSARQELEALLTEVIPEEKRTGDVEQMALDYIKELRSSNDRIIEAISDDPRAAQMFADIVNGTRKPGAAIARYFGKGFMADEGTPEYDEMMAADEEFFNERESAKRTAEEHNAKMLDFLDWLEGELGEEEGAEGERIRRVYNEIIIPLLDGVKDETLPGKLKKSLDYDKDVEDAFVAGEVKGRNMNINEMRSKVGDGMPKGLTSQAMPVVEQPKRKVNSLIAKALNA